MLRIDIQRLSRKIKELREGFERDLENGIADPSDYRDELRFMANADRFLWQPEKARTAEDLRVELVTASVAAGQYGATDTQINHIVWLAKQSGDFTGLGSGRLTMAQAETIINDMEA